MGYATPPTTIKAARKDHRCTWCGQKIDAGQPYERWRWYSDDGEADTCKMHPECVAALDAQIAYDGDNEFMPYGNARGCTCGGEVGCEQCASHKKGGAA